MRDRVQGGVLMRGVVEADGTVGAIQVLQSLHPELDAEAGKAFRQWRFKPGTYMGDPAAIIVAMEMTFSLRDRK
jgi:TonB family protein